MRTILPKGAVYLWFPEAQPVLLAFSVGKFHIRPALLLAHRKHRIVGFLLYFGLEAASSIQSAVP
ncbi:MAG: hypothetical protein VB041_08145 [Candidatus Limiplasma sp.]|nr:hypothetical protein [Candidatus Limiplasma sp.]